MLRTGEAILHNGIFTYPVILSYYAISERLPCSGREIAPQTWITAETEI